MKVSWSPRTAAAMCSLLVFGCASSQQPPPEPTAGASAAAPASNAPEVPLEALEASFDGEAFEVRYRAGEKELWSRGRLGSVADQPGAADISAGIHYGDFLLLLDEHAEVPPAGALSTDHRLAILDAAAWRALVAEINRNVAPAEIMTGSVVDFLGEAEYVVYRDAGGAIRVALLQFKPRDVAVGRTYDFDEMVQLARPMLGHILEERGITARRVLIDTGDSGPYAFPFVYVDLDDGTVFFARLIPDEVTETHVHPHSGLHKLAHLGKSTVGMIVRPVSTLHDLFFVTVDTTADLVRPEDFGRLADQPIPPLADGPGMDLAAWEDELDRIAHHPSSRAEMRLLVGGEEFFPVFIDAIENVDASVDIRCYIFEDDAYALEIADLLKRQSHRAEVRVLLDGFPTLGAAGAHPRTDGVPDERPGSIRSYLREGSRIKVILRPYLVPFLDHTKTMVVDSRVAYLGGMNIGHVYRYEWHDMMMEVEGPVVDQIDRQFDLAWAAASTGGDLAKLAAELQHVEPSPEMVGVPVRLLLTRPGRSEILHAQLAAIQRAQRRIWIENAYFSDDRVLYELVKARRRGVDVRVILPAKGNWGTMNHSNAIAANTMLTHGIRVYLYPGMSHVKAALYDGWACFGSANFDEASLRNNHEADLATSDPAVVEELEERLFLPDFDRAVELEEPFPVNWHDHLFELMADAM